MPTSPSSSKLEEKSIGIGRCRQIAVSIAALVLVIAGLVFLLSGSPTKHTALRDVDNNFYAMSSVEDRIVEDVKNAASFYETEVFVNWEQQDALFDTEVYSELELQMFENDTDGGRNLGAGLTDFLGALGTAVQAYDGDPNSLDVEGQIISKLFLAGCTAAAFKVGLMVSAATFNPYPLLLPKACPLLSLFVEQLCDRCFSKLIDAIDGNPKNDDATVVLSTPDQVNAEGDTMRVAFHRANGDTDTRHMGYIGRNAIVSKTEDLDKSHLIELEFYIGKETDDICFNAIGVTLGPEPSGTGKVETFILEAGHVSYITAGKGVRNNECIRFGDDEGSIANFKINWPAALICRNNFFIHTGIDYAKCLTYAMYRFDFTENGNIWRRNFNFDGLPKEWRFPHQWTRNKGIGGGEMCINLESWGTKNGNPIYLRPCWYRTLQQFDHDSEGRLRSRINPSKCLEAGKEGKLYSKAFIWDCNEEEHQKWDVRSDGRIKNKAFDKYLGVAYCGTKPDKMQIELHNYGQCGEGQKWERFWMTG